MWGIGLHLDVKTKRECDFKQRSKFVIPTDGAKLMMLRSSIVGFVQKTSNTSSSKFLKG